MPGRIPRDPLGRILHELKKIGRKINRLNCNLTERIDTMADKVSQDVQTLIEEVALDKTVTDGLFAQLDSIADRLDAGAGNKAAIAQVVTDLRDVRTRAQLATAMLANTPAAGTETPPVVPPVTP